jgi:uncharacterized protein
MSYQILPFRFEKFNEKEVFLSNESGEFLFISNEEFNELINHKLNLQTKTALNLKNKQILTDTDVAPVVKMLATKYRTKKSFLNNFTALHMVVPTLCCNASCIYCQASRKDINAENVDMDKQTAKKIVNLILKSPSQYIKIEFQGGEPLLNFEIVQYIIEYAELRNIFSKKNLSFVICTNLTNITEKMLHYLKNHKVHISTSLDGDRDLHNINRPMQNASNTYDILVENIRLCRKYLGKNGVSALMTASVNSLERGKSIVDEYLTQGFNSIFLRSLNPYGFAKCNRKRIGYTTNDFLKFYKETLEYIIDINLRGAYFLEGFATLILTRLLTPFSTGFVDMQSPAGVGISGVIYDYNGDVYVSDEGRMLAAMGDKRFLMGNVRTASYEELFDSDFMHSLINLSCLECLPVCEECGFQSYCGADPVRNYSEQGDIVGHRPTSDVCLKNKVIIKYILELIKRDDENINNVFWSWITRRSINKNSESL